MKLLLDTHTFLWFVNGNSQLSLRARLAIEDLNHERFFSIASVWEMAIKNGLGKLPLAEPIETFVPTQLRTNRIDVLPITPEHAFRAGQLPFHHRDPFDRIIIAQSLAENIALVSADSTFDSYTGLTRFW